MLELIDWRNQRVLLAGSWVWLSGDLTSNGGVVST